MRRLLLACCLFAVLACGVLIARERGGDPPSQSAAMIRVGERDISSDHAIESEAAIALDPSYRRVLLAGSNVPHGDTREVYNSLDGGASWRAGRLPPPRSAFGASDPTVAIGLDDLQYYAFLGINCGDGRARRLEPTYLASLPSNKTVAGADRGNGFGDYEVVAAGVYAVWTDGGALAQRREEICAARISLEARP